MEVEIVKQKIGEEELKKLAKGGYGEMVKVAVDVKKRIMAVGGEFHCDSLEALLKEGSEPKDVWGCNIYLGKPGDERIEFFALINVRPQQGNRSMEIEDNAIREKIKEIINELIC